MDDERVLLSSWQKPLYNLAYRALGHREDAADATQDIFLAIVRNMPSLPSAERRRAWIFRVAHNIVCTYIRKRRRSRVEAAGAVEAEDAGRHEAEAERKEDLERLQASLLELPEEQRLPLLMAYDQGLTQAEIGAALDLPRTTVQSRLKKGVERLRSSLGAGSPAIIPDLLGSLPRHEVPPGLAARLAMTAAAPTSGAAFLIGGAVSKTKITIVAVILAALSFGAGLSLRARAEGPKMAKAQGSTELVSLRQEKADLEEKLASLAKAPAPVASPKDSDAELAKARAELEKSRARNKDLQTKLSRLVAEQSERSAATVLRRLFALYREHDLAEEMDTLSMEEAQERGRVISTKVSPLLSKLIAQGEEARELLLAVVQDRGSADRAAGFALLSAVTLMNELGAEERNELNRELIVIAEDGGDNAAMRCKALALIQKASTELHPQLQSLGTSLREHEDPALRKEAWKILAQLPEEWLQREVEDYLFDAQRPVDARRETLLGMALDQHPRAPELLDRALKSGGVLRKTAVLKSMMTSPRPQIASVLVEAIRFGFKADQGFFLPGAIALHGDEATARRLEELSRDQGLSEDGREIAAKSLEELRKNLAKKAQR